MKTRLQHLLFVVVILFSAGAGWAYDPLAALTTKVPPALDLSITDRLRQRQIPLRVYLPADQSPAPVVLFSHGLGGMRLGSGFLGEHWAARGYVVIFLQHPGSDDKVWRERPTTERLTAMHQAASAQNLMLRITDVVTVLDQLTVWNNQAQHFLAGRLDLKHIGMSGHSFGAVTTQAVSGQQFPFGNRRYTDSRIKAALALSPSSPRVGTPAAAFGAVKIPWLLMTGTKDVAPIGGATVASRRAVYAALPAGGKYELVLDRAEHSAFTDRPLPGDTERRNPNHHRAMLAISTAFWDTWLAGDADARAWLHGDGPRSVLEPADEWQRK